jgi:hypothetical protein
LFRQSPKRVQPATFITLSIFKLRKERREWFHTDGRSRLLEADAALCECRFDLPVLDARGILKVTVGNAVLSRAASVGLAKAVDEMCAIPE